jgi:hypothetical protein
MHSNMETTEQNPLIWTASSSTVIQRSLHSLKPHYCIGNLIETSAYVHRIVHVDGVRLSLSRGHKQANCSHPWKYLSMETRRDNIDRGTPKNSGKKPCPSATLSTKNPTQSDPVAKPGLRGDRPATNRLSHGTAYSLYSSWLLWPLGTWQWKISPSTALSALRFLPNPCLL